jgi:16S rRNA (guanine(527)-N(7))-methyltransferase RsmG
MSSSLGGARSVHKAALVHALDALSPEFGMVLGADVRERLAVHYEILSTWNRHLNLTRVTEPLAAARFHYLESLLGAGLIADARARIVDIGSGAGFPGLPLAALDPSRPVLLVEANTRRAVFLREAASAMGLASVAVRNHRFDARTLERSDVAVARAVDQFESLVPSLVRSPARQVLLWGDRRLLDLASEFEPDRGTRSLLVPGSRQRFIGSFDRPVPRETIP